MTENNESFSDITGLVGIRPESADEEASESESQESEVDSNEESGELEQADASKEESAEGDEEESQGEEGDESEGESEESEIKALKAQVADKEQQRRDWQGKAMSSDSDLGKALDALAVKTTATAKEVPDASAQAMEKLAGLGNDEMVDAGTLKEVLQTITTAQQANSQQQTMDGLTNRINEAVREKSDLSDVQEFYKQNSMSRDKDANLTNDLGNYWRARALRTENQLKEAGDKGKAEGAKTEQKRQKRLKKIPSVSGSQADSTSRDVSEQDDPSGIINRMAARRKARGIRPDGAIR